MSAIDSAHSDDCILSPNHYRLTVSKCATKCSGIKAATAVLSGVPPGDQCLIHAARLMQDSETLNEHGVSNDSTIHLTGRLRGGATGWQLIVKPRIQKDKWSNYWKVGFGTVTSQAVRGIEIAVPTT